MAYTFTQLTGSTGSSSPQTYGMAFTTLNNNNSANSLAVGKTLVNNAHRFLIENYFDNERSLSIAIVGSGTITFTASLASGATSATLSSSWPSITCQQLVNFSSGDQRLVQFIKGSTAITWQVGLSTSASSSAGTAGVRDYPIPANISKIKDVTITVGQLVFTPKWVQTRAEWDYINTIPYNSDIPQYVYIYNGTCGIWPIPTTPNNVLTFNYQTRVPDLTFQDFSTGTISAASVNGYSVTGSGTSWNTTGGFPINTNITFLNLNLRIDPPYGDGLWYPIQSFQSDTALTLALPIVNAPNISSATYTIGQIPILQEDYHPLIVYHALRTYFSSIVKDTERYNAFNSLYTEGLEMMKQYLGTKALNVDLEQEIYLNNPNLFEYQST